VEGGLDLARSLVDGHDEAVGLILPDVGVRREADPAEDLHGVPRDVCADLRGEVLAQGGEEPQARDVALVGLLNPGALGLGEVFARQGGLARQVRIEQAVGPVEQGAHRLIVHRHLGEHGHDERLLCDGLPELLPLVRVLGRVVERRIREAQRLGGDAEPGGVHEVQHGAEPLPLLTEPLSDCAFEDDLAGRGAVDSQLLLEARHAYAVSGSILQVPGYENERQAVGRSLGLVEGVAVPGEYEVDLGAPVRDEDLLAVDLYVAVREVGDAHGDPAEVAPRLGLREVHRSLELAGDKARQVGAFDLLASVLCDVVRGASLEPDGHHEARVGPADHLQDEAVHERRDSVAAVFLAHRQAHEAGLLELRVGLSHVSGRDCPAVGRQLRLGGPVLPGRLLEVGGEGGAGLEDGAVGAHLGFHVHSLAVAKGEEGLPVDEMVEVEAHSGSEVVLHGGISSEIGTEW
jgi:hypothetical protein